MRAASGRGQRHGVRFYALNAGLTWQTRIENFRITAYGNNLTDNQANVTALPLVGATQSTGIAWSDTRTYGVELAYTW